MTPLGFLVLMLGFGLRLDTEWQGLAWALLLAGAGGLATGFARAREPSARDAFVPGGGGE